MSQRKSKASKPQKVKGELCFPISFSQKESLKHVVRTSILFSDLFYSLPSILPMLKLLFLELSSFYWYLPLPSVLCPLLQLNLLVQILPSLPKIFWIPEVEKTRLLLLVKYNTHIFKRNSICRGAKCSIFYIDISY